MKIKFEYRNYHLKITDAELTADIIAVSKKIRSKTVRMTDYDKHGKFRSETIRLRFGSWYVALMQAGLKPSKRVCNAREVTEEKLYKNLEKVWIKLGRQPKRREMVAPLSWNCASIYRKFFGSWSMAVKKFIDYKNNGSKNSVKGSAAKKESIRAPENVRQVSSKLRYSVFIRDGMRCTVCGKSPITHPGLVLHCDHIDPWSKGGRTVMENLRTLCAECNLGKGDRVIATKRMEFTPRL